MGGSSKKETTQQTSTNTLDPAYSKMLTDNYSAAQGRANSLTPYTGQLTAGFTPTQIQAQGVLSGVGTDPKYGANNDNAISAVNGVLGYQPTNVDPSTIAGADLSQYENPFTSSVIDSTIAQQERARQIAGVSDNAHATAAGAFGGSRSGVLSALTNEGYDRNTGDLIANLNAANFNQAQGAAATDAATKNQVGEFNATNANTAAGLRLNAAGQLVSDNTAALGTAATQGGILGAVGDAQQAQNQSELDRAYQAYTQGQQLTLQQQQLLNSALGLIPNQQTVSSNGTNTTKENPGLGGILSSLGSIAQGAAMFA